MATLMSIVHGGVASQDAALSSQSADFAARLLNFRSPRPLENLSKLCGSVRKRREATFFVAELARVPKLHANFRSLAISATGFFGQTDGKTASVKTAEFG
jgi:hypothetical protein